MATRRAHPTARAATAPARAAAAWRSAAWALTVGACAAAAAPAAAANRLAEDALAPPVAAATTAASALGHYLAGRVARRDGDAAAAADFLDAALADDPGNRRLQRDAVAALIAAGRWERGLKLAAELQAQRPRDHLGAIVRAVAAAREGDFEAVREVAGGASRRGSNRVLVPLMRAWSHAASRRLEAAFEALEAVPDSRGFAHLRSYHGALIDDLLGRRERADNAYRGLTERRADAAIGTRGVQAYGNFLQRAGRGEEAAQLYRRALARDPDDVVLARLAATAPAATAPEPFVADARAGIAEALLGVAGLLSQDNALELATIHARLAVYLRRDLAAAQLLVGRMLEWRGQWPAAIDAYRAIDPGSDHAWEARLRTATNLQRLERRDEAVALLEEMVDTRPARADALLALGDLYRSDERLARGRRRVRPRGDARARAQGQPDWTLFYNRGIALERAKLWQRAEADFLRALELRPDQPLVLNYLGYSWVEQGRHLDRAREMIEKAVSLRPRDGYIVDSLGWVLYRLDDFAGAVEQLERAVELRPLDPVINDHLGDAYWRVGRKLEAKFQWRRSLTFAPPEDMVPMIRRKLDQGLDR